MSTKRFLISIFDLLGMYKLHNPANTTTVWQTNESDFRNESLADTNNFELSLCRHLGWIDCKLHLSTSYAPANSRKLAFG